MQRRDALIALTASTVTAAIVAKPAQAQSCTPPCYPVIAAETAASVTVYDTSHPPGDLRRYFNGGSDWSSALSQLRAVAAQGVACVIPNGTYSYSTSPNWAVPHLQLTGEPGAILQHTGSGVAFNMDAGGSGAGVYELTISNLVISGNSSTTDGFYSRGMTRSVFSKIEVRNCTGKAFHIRFGVANHYDTCIASGNVTTWTTVPTHGFYLDNDGTVGYYTANCTFTNCMAEAFAGKGCALADASGCTFIGGTFEGVLIGLDIDTDTCRHNRFVSVWFEANTYWDARVKGTGNSFCNCYFGSAASFGTVGISTGAATVFEGGFARMVELQSTSQGTFFSGVMFSDYPGVGVVGSGTYRMVGCVGVDTNIDFTRTLTSIP